MDKIEDEYDLACYKRAMEEFQKDPETYSFEEAMKALDLSGNIRLRFQIRH